MKKLRFVGVLGVAALALAACGDNKSSSTTSTSAKGSTTTAGAATTAGGATTSVNVSQGQNIEIAVITHGDGGIFWSVAQKGAEDAGKALGIKVRYFGSNNTGTAQADAINQAVA